MVPDLITPPVACARQQYLRTAAIEAKAWGVRELEGSQKRLGKLSTFLQAYPNWM
jgi:hypothetical protein